MQINLPLPLWTVQDNHKRYNYKNQWISHTWSIFLGSLYWILSMLIKLTWTLVFKISHSTTLCCHSLKETREFFLSFWIWLLPCVTSLWKVRSNQDNQSSFSERQSGQQKILLLATPSSLGSSFLRAVGVVKKVNSKQKKISPFLLLVTLPWVEQERSGTRIQIAKKYFLAAH